MHVIFTFVPLCTSGTWLISSSSSLLDVVSASSTARIVVWSAIIIISATTITLISTRGAVVAHRPSICC